MRLSKLVILGFGLCCSAGVWASQQLTLHVTMTGLQNTTHVATGCPAPTPSNFSMSTSNVVSHCTAVTGGQSTCTLALSSSGSTETLALHVTPSQVDSTHPAGQPYPKCTSLATMHVPDDSITDMYPGSGATLPHGLEKGLSTYAQVCGRPTNCKYKFQSLMGFEASVPYDCDPVINTSVAYNYGAPGIQQGLVDYAESQNPKCSFSGFTVSCEQDGASYTAHVSFNPYQAVRKPCADFTPGPVVSKSYTFTIPDASTAPSANTLSGLMSDVSRMGCSRWVGGVVDHSAVTGYIRRQLIASCQASASATTVNLYCSYSATSGISCTPPQ